MPRIEDRHVVTHKHAKIDVMTDRLAKIDTHLATDRQKEHCITERNQQYMHICRIHNLSFGGREDDFSSFNTGVRLGRKNQKGLSSQGQVSGGRGGGGIIKMLGAVRTVQGSSTDQGLNSPRVMTRQTVQGS